MTDVLAYKLRFMKKTSLQILVPNSFWFQRYQYSVPISFFFKQFASQLALNYVIFVKL